MRYMKFQKLQSHSALAFKIRHMISTLIHKSEPSEGDLVVIESLKSIAAEHERLSLVQDTFYR